MIGFVNEILNLFTARINTDMPNLLQFSRL